MGKFDSILEELRSEEGQRNMKEYFEKVNAEAERLNRIKDSQYIGNFKSYLFKINEFGNELYIQLRSENKNTKFDKFDNFIGKNVRVTVEIIDDKKKQMKKNNVYSVINNKLKTLRLYIIMKQFFCKHEINTNNVGYINDCPKCGKQWF